jgi:membrane associated rhomboid family serine protease
VTITNVLIGINVIAFIWQLSTGGPDYDHGYLYGPAVVHGQWWRVFTAAFLHGSYVHIGLNMLALFQVGNIVETIFGKPRYVLLYTIAIVGSGLAVLYFNFGVPTLGASGAIFGLFGALVAVGLRLGSRGRSLIGQVLPIVVINLVFTFSVPGISAAAHVGGLITGFLTGLVLFMTPACRAPVYATVAQPAAVPFDPARHAPVETIEQSPEPRE